MPARPFHGPDAARPVAGAKDPSRADARFNGRPGWFIDPGHVVPAGAAVVAATTAARSSFFPGRRSVRAGESVRFEMSARSTELHNVVFGPEDVPERTAAAFITIGLRGSRTTRCWSTRRRRARSRTTAASSTRA
jgi:hypothetical protein